MTEYFQSPPNRPIGLSKRKLHAMRAADKPNVYHTVAPISSSQEDDRSSIPSLRACAYAM